MANKFSSEKAFGPRSVADFEGIDDPGERDRIQRDAYERVNALLRKLKVGSLKPSESAVSTVLEKGGEIRIAACI